MREEGESCGVSANEYSGTHGAQINFGDLTPYLTYAPERSLIFLVNKIRNKVIYLMRRGSPE
jgi:hypothetical protein